MIRIAVIVGQLFPVSDIPEGHQPDHTGGLFDGAVGITGVVAIARRVPEARAINIIALVESENIDIAVRQAPGTFGFGNLFADVGEYPGPLCDLLGGEEPEPGNRRFMDSETHLHRIHPHHTSLDYLWASSPDHPRRRPTHTFLRAYGCDDPRIVFHALSQGTTSPSPW
jgi:hypothetical protein